VTLPCAAPTNITAAPHLAASILLDALNVFLTIPVAL
jgi:hypothetical protein